jgi:hypothetical protein
MGLASGALVQHVYSPRRALTSTRTAAARPAAAQAMMNIRKSSTAYIAETPTGIAESER